MLVYLVLLLVFGFTMLHFGDLVVWGLALYRVPHLLGSAMKQKLARCNVVITRALHPLTTSFAAVGYMLDAR